MKIISITRKRTRARKAAWGPIETKPDGSMVTTLFRPWMKMLFELEITPDEYVYIIDNSINKVKYSEMLNRHFDIALAEYIKEINEEELSK